MLSRRNVLIAAGMAGVAALSRRIPSVFASAPQPKTPVNFSVPVNACDCHSHIFGDLKQFPIAPSSSYTPDPATVEEMSSLHQALHTSRFVLVQPSSYDTDNSCMLDAIKRLGPGARGIAALGEKTSNADLDEMHRLGIRGIRINLGSERSDPSISRQRLLSAIERIKGRGWHMEMYTQPPVIEAIKDQVMASPVPVSFDHFGGAQAALGLHQPGFDALLSLVHSGKAYVKVSAPYRSSKQTPDYQDIAPFAKALIAANPERITWGSDWPHRGYPQIDAGLTLNQFATWTSGPAQLKLILVDNPARLYGF